MGKMFPDLSHIIQATPNEVLNGTGLLCELKRSHASEDFTLLADGVAVSIHPSTVGAFQSREDGREIFHGA